MPNLSIFPPEMAASLWRNQSLIIALVKREVVGHYRGSIIRIAWSSFNPLLMLVIYTFVFSVIFKARWGVGGEKSKTDFAIILFVGLIVHRLFAECVTRPYIDSLQRQLCKESNFPPENPSLGRFWLGAVPHRHQPWRAASLATDYCWHWGLLCILAKIQRGQTFSWRTFVKLALDAAGYSLTDEDFLRFVALEAVIQQQASGRTAQEFLNG